MPLVRYGTIAVSRVVAAMIAGEERIMVADKSVPITSNRVRTYTKGTVCIKCGLEGAFFAAEESVAKCHAPRGNAHMNLYAMKDGKEILMTSDHINPKWAGGKDDLENRQPMCSPCNSKKGHDVEDPHLHLVALGTSIKNYERKIHDGLIKLSKIHPNSTVERRGQELKLCNWRGELAKMRRKVEEINRQLKAPAVVEEMAEA